MNLVCLFPVLVLGFTLEAVGPVHVFCFMVSAIDEHSVWIQPYDIIMRRVGRRDGGTSRVHLKARAVRITSIDQEPRSTRSPFMRRWCDSDGSPVREKRCNIS